SFPRATKSATPIPAAISRQPSATRTLRPTGLLERQLADRDEDVGALLRQQRLAGLGLHPEAVAALRRLHEPPDERHLLPYAQPRRPLALEVDLHDDLVRVVLAGPEAVDPGDLDDLSRVCADRLRDVAGKACGEQWIEIPLAHRHAAP